MRAPETKRRDGQRRQLFPPGSALMSRSKRKRAEQSSRASMAIRSGWERSAPAPRTARRICALVCRSPRLHLAAGASTRRLTYWSGDWPGAVCWSTASSDRASDEDQVVIEPQVADYWPGTPPLDNADVLVLSRFAYMRRRGNEMVLESPRAGALFKICNPKIAAAIAMLSHPATNQTAPSAGRISGDRASRSAGRIAKSFSRSTLPATVASDAAEGDDNLVLWDFHDLLFHARSTEGRHANPLGGLIHMPASCLRCRRYGPAGPERRSICASSRPRIRRQSRRSQSSCTNVIRPATSMTRDRSRSPSFRGFLTAPRVSCRDGAARSTSATRGPMVAYTVRPYPSAGASYELELYLAVDKCEGLARGFYHYDAGGHALVPIGARTHELEALLTAAQFAMDAPAAPQILITIAARFGRISWKYSSLAYALILKDVGVLTANALPDGDGHGARRMRDRDHQYRSVREDDGNRIPR